jgi:hypothetical protein
MGGRIFFNSMETFEKIIEQYTQSEVCMGELLANISADGMSIEDAFELYIKAMNYAEKDEFYQLADGEVKLLTAKSEDDKQPLKQLFDSLSMS